jgi:hypothetical protein
MRVPQKLKAKTELIVFEKNPPYCTTSSDLRDLPEDAKQLVFKNLVLRSSAEFS